MGDLVEHGLGHTLFVEQVMVMPGYFVTLRQHRGLQATQTVHRTYLGGENHRAVGLGHEVVATGFQATHQRLLFVERGQEDDRHQRLARQCLDLARSLEAIHHRHQGIEQYQLRPALGKQRHCLLAVVGGKHLMPLAPHDLRQQHAISGTVLGDQYGQRLFGRHGRAQPISNSLSKLEMARILRTSGLAWTTRMSESSPPTWSRSNSSMPNAELSR